MNAQMLGCPELATFWRAATSTDDMSEDTEESESSTLMATDCPLVEGAAATKTLPVAPLPNVSPEKT